MFANVGQRAVRTVARQTFEHLLNLDLKFHLSRQTGGLTRAIDRGTKCVYSSHFFQYHRKNLARFRGTYGRGVTFILQSILFRVIPTALEISLVCGILVRWRALFQSRLVDVVSVDVQVWLGLCGYHTRDHGRLHLVYHSYYCMAVR